MSDQSDPVGPIRGLPFAGPRSFARLDDYLAFLQERGGYDVPWYREIKPGLFQQVTRARPGQPARTFSREELERKFGFRR